MQSIIKDVQTSTNFMYLIPAHVCTPHLLLPSLTSSSPSLTPPPLFSIPHPHPFPSPGGAHSKERSSQRLHVVLVPFTARVQDDVWFLHCCTRTSPNIRVDPLPNKALLRTLPPRKGRERERGGEDLKTKFLCKYICVHKDCIEFIL